MHPVQSLRRRTLLWLALGVAVAMSLINAVCDRLVMHGFLELEQRLCVRNFERVREAIWRENEAVAMKVSDWAVWDDSYRFLARETDEGYDAEYREQYIHSNLHASAMELLGIHGVVYFDRDGRRVLDRADKVDLSSGPVAEELDRVGRRALEGPVLGPIIAGDMVMLVSGRPVLRGDGSGPPRGALVFVRAVDRELIRRLQTITHSTFNLNTNRVASGATVEVTWLDENRALATGSLTGVWGEPIATLEAFKPREVAAKGWETLRDFNVALLASWLVFGALTMVVFGRLVLGRIEQLGYDVTCVTSAGSASRRVRPQGADELGSLAGSINDMLESLDRSALELRARNQELASARDAADAASRAKSAFLANMSHEIRTPMAAVMGFADLLLDPEQTPEDRVECVQTIRRNAEHLLGIINDLLDLSKIEAGKLAIELIECDLPDIVRGVMAVAQVKAASKGIGVAAEFRPGVPMRIVTDPTRLTQILVNLVGNAVKFTESGGVRLIVGVHPGPGERPVLRFEVLDTGIGMTERQVAGLFRPFEQADVSTTRRFGGTGLGLTISRDLARALGGDIAVVSVAGEGSTFTVTIDGAAAPSHIESTPADVGLGPAPSVAPATRELSVPAAPVSGGVRVLLAEDGPDNQRLISFHLRRLGASVDLASNGREAVERALAAAGAGTPYDVVLMDMQMPELDGYSATSLLRQQGYTGTIVALTANAMAGDRDKCIGAGCDEHLTKPVQTDQLAGVLDEARGVAGSHGSARRADAGPLAA
jgi:signal transduction histidine kinase/ActR/RegA family two-component response regulator